MSGFYFGVNTSKSGNGVLRHGIGLTLSFLFLLIP